MDNEVIEAHLNDSLQKNLIYLHYQPKVDILTRKICGAEALIRLPHLNGVYVQPSKIISLAYRTHSVLVDLVTPVPNQGVQRIFFTDAPDKLVQPIIFHKPCHAMPTSQPT